jgi:hypothetical protein
MIPDTIGALLGFLGLVAPGLTYRAVIERRTARHSESVFTEISRVALTSLVFTLAATSLLWLLHLSVRMAVPAVDAWLLGGTAYAAAHLGTIFFGLLAEVAIACALAMAVAWILTRRSQSRFRDESVFGAVFRRYAPKDYFSWVHVRLDNDVEFWGFERAHDDRDDAIAPRLVLGGSTLMRRLPGETDRKAIGKDWDLVVIDATRIRFLQITYLNHEGQTARAVTKAHVPRRPSRRPVTQQSNAGG